ncbi:hypothetical protein FF098_015905 [Parvularcula flava]|uniref:Uncharacterized protein n=1 Tax=Aquisalinus luteolus TaxID=1566827 RepID=A0A8J3AAP3_9PROT|nr:hypothetical protein [Aquisalinus luteolus]NHK29400.1 hypothetical protein [Aquisalinus luteolus]GGI02064.1 hypothetical protein GCM10011355_34190 [Aquisalinus luteolus]
MSGSIVEKSLQGVFEYRTRLSTGKYPDEHITMMGVGPCQWEETLDEDGQLHSYFDRPSLIGRDLTTGDVLFQAWHQAGDFHRTADDPAIIYGYDGQFRQEQYWVNGVQHRDEKYGPASFEIDLQTNVVVWETYYRMGKNERRHGPAHICRDSDGTVYDEEFIGFEGRLMPLSPDPSIV